jgi:hypothetical protein
MAKCPACGIVDGLFTEHLAQRHPNLADLPREEARAALASRDRDVEEYVPESRQTRSSRKRKR